MIMYDIACTLGVQLNVTWLFELDIVVHDVLAVRDVKEFNEKMRFDVEGLTGKVRNCEWDVLVALNMNVPDEN